MTPSPSKNISGRNPLFGLLVFLLALTYVYLISGWRIPAGHDTFEYFYLQYYFLNNAVTAGQFPFWVPYTTHGVVSAFWYFIQAGMLQNVLLSFSVLAGPVLKNVNFIPLFNLGMFADELLLLTGSWLLARRLFPSRLTAFFVAATVMGSCVWALQVWFNFHFYYALPLILFFGHRFLDTGRWRFLFLGGCLSAFQMLGNLPYLIPVTTLTAAAYFFFFILLGPGERLRAFLKNRDVRPGLGAALAVLFFFFLIYLTVTLNSDQTVRFVFGRTADGHVPLKEFLVYGKNLGLKKWAELFLGLSPITDMTLYMGALPLILIPLAFCFRGARKNLHLAFLVITLTLFSAGTLFSRIMYFIWPFMKFYRHLGLVAPVIKLFLCFWAGAGFEALLAVARKPEANASLKKGLLFFSGLVLLLSLGLFVLSREPGVVRLVLSRLIEKSSHYTDGTSGHLNFIAGLSRFYNPALLPVQLLAAGLTALAVSLSGIILALQKKAAAARTLLVLMLLAHVLGIQHYKFFQLSRKTVPVARPYREVTRFQAMPFHRRRAPAFRNDTLRTDFLNQLSMMTPCWSVYAFFFRDEAGHDTRTDFWMKPMDDYLRTYRRPPPDDEAPTEAILRYYLWEFPLSHPASGKIAGVTADKVQFFRRASTVASKSEMSRLMRDPGYAGDLIFLAPGPLPAPRWDNSVPLSENDHVPLDYRVRRFDANNLVLSVAVPGPNPLWMLYSDVWAPGWTAAVNGSPVPVGKAILAYKAIRLPPGNDTVRFSFRDRRLEGLYLFWGLTACLWLGIVLLLAGRITFREGGVTAEE